MFFKPLKLLFLVICILNILCLFNFLFKASLHAFYKGSNKMANIDIKVDYLFLLLMGFYAYKKWFHIGFWILLTILDPIIEMESIL